MQVGCIYQFEAMSLTCPLPNSHGDHRVLKDINNVGNEKNHVVVVAVGCFILGTIFGAIAMVFFSKLKMICSRQAIDGPLCNENGTSRSFSTTRPKRTKQNSDIFPAVMDADARKRDIKYRRRRRMNSVSDEARLFANSIRKFTLLNEFQHGLIEARGIGLEIVSIDPIMHRLLGWPGESQSKGGDADVLSLPSSVHDLLPVEFREIHRKFLAKAAVEGELPSSLMHPLRNVPILRLDGSTVHVDVCVGVITKDLPLSSEGCMFYALVSQRHDDSPPCSHARDDEPAAMPESIASIAQALYGHNVGLSVARGVLPRPEDYAKVRRLKSTNLNRTLRLHRVSATQHLAANFDSKKSRDPIASPPSRTCALGPAPAPAPALEPTPAAYAAAQPPTRPLSRAVAGDGALSGRGRLY